MVAFKTVLENPCILEIWSKEERKLTLKSIPLPLVLVLFQVGFQPKHALILVAFFIKERLNPKLEQSNYYLL